MTLSMPEVPKGALWTRRRSQCHVCGKWKNSLYLLLFHYDRRHQGWTTADRSPISDEPETT